jgi:hypothetical protein
LIVTQHPALSQGRVAVITGGASGINLADIGRHGDDLNARNFGRGAIEEVYSLHMCRAAG